MINIVIYDEDNITKDYNINIINKVFFNENYHIYKYSKYDNKLDNIINNKLFKIYIININNDYNFNIIKKIRNIDLISMIIAIIDINMYKEYILNNNFLIVNYINKTINYENILRKSLLYIIDYYYKDKALIFKYKYTLYRLIYSDINYIEKESMIKRCIIHGINNGEYYIINSLNNIINMLNSYFIRTHQSCIVNIRNIKNIDLVNNIIIFKDGSSTDLLTDKMKKELIDIMGK